MANSIPADALPGNRLPIMSVDPEMLKQAPPVYIFNVGPETHSVTRGGLGEFVIPGCPKGEKVSAPLQLTGIYPQQSCVGEVIVTGYLLGSVLAEDILGVKSTMPTNCEFTTNLTWKGVFASLNATPTDDEIKAANAKRKERIQFFIEDGDRRAQIGPGDNGTGGLSVNHRAALVEANLKRSWAAPAVAQEECPACGSAIKAGIARCPHCRAIIDEDKARKFFPELFQAPPSTRVSDAVASADTPAESAASEPSTPPSNRSRQGNGQGR